MLEATQVVEKLMNNMGRGLVYINREQRILICNQKARAITGIDFDHTNTHEGGQLAPGDIVIITDNDLGDDDGDLTSEDLSLINISDKGINQRDMFIGVGVYKNRKIEPSYKYVREHQLRTPFELDVHYLGFHIVATIDTIKKMMSIQVNGKVFAMNFYNAVGHMVVINGSNGRIKFFQMPGYSVRKESIGVLLRGGQFLAKNSDSGFSIIGQKMLNVFEESPLTQKVIELFNGQKEPIKDTLYEINRRPFICSLMPSFAKDNPEVVEGVFIILQDATELEAMLEDRNRIIAQIEKKNHEHSTFRNAYPEDAFQDFVGDGPLIQDVKYLAYKASQTKFNVIITGESGTGKSHLAREIHDLQNKDGAFVEVNCSTIAPTLFESELFGYVGGAFTGAASGGKAGYFEAANKGTIFLDEIGEIPLDIQVKLLQVLQSKTLYRVGSSKPVHVDVRVIAATNKNLEQEVEKGSFRSDLYYRINVFPIEIPPLRERKTDLYVLINQILQKTCKRYEVTPKQFSGEAFRKMLAYSWPGNIRELENIIVRAITLCESNLIYPEHISLTGQKNPKSMKERLQDEEVRIMQEALMRHNGDKQKVMHELQMSKSVFYEKCKRYGIG